jgi:hypothetical protein
MIQLESRHCRAARMRACKIARAYPSARRALLSARAHYNAVAADTPTRRMLDGLIAPECPPRLPRLTRPPRPAYRAGAPPCRSFRLARGACAPAKLQEHIRSARRAASAVLSAQVLYDAVPADSHTECVLWQRVWLDCTSSFARTLHMRGIALRRHGDCTSTSIVPAEPCSQERRRFTMQPPPRPTYKQAGDLQFHRCLFARCYCAPAESIEK